MEDFKKDLGVIQQLMDELCEKMEYGKDDLEERLGRKKPEVEVMKIEAKPEMADQLEEEDEMVDAMGDEEEMDPDEAFKSRLMKLRA